MKKTIIAILSVVLVLSLSVVALVACNKTEEKAQVSNSEVLGTAVAVAAQSLAGVSSETTEGSEDFNAGINLTVGTDSIGMAAGAKINGIASVINPVINETVNRIDKFLGENGIKVEKVASDREGYTDKLAISGTYIDEETGESTTYEYALYVGVQGGDGIDGKKNYTFNALLVIPTDGDPLEYSFSGTATYDEAKDAMIFDLGAQTGSTNLNALASAKAYATKSGNVVVELNASAGAWSTVANASISVELGKLAENTYGAVVRVNGTFATSGEESEDKSGAFFSVVLNVKANNAENAKDFDINGNFEASIAIPKVMPVVGGTTYKATADLSGKAHYVVEDDSLEVSLNGNVQFTQEKQEENK